LFRHAKADRRNQAEHGPGPFVLVSTEIRSPLRPPTFAHDRRRRLSRRSAEGAKADHLLSVNELPVDFDVVRTARALGIAFGD
jgi:hypothetical protein